MPIRCDTSDAPAFVRFTFTSDWRDAVTLIDLWRQVVRAGQLTVKSAVLFDLRLLSKLPDPTELHHALLDAHLEAAWPLCRAYLVGSPDQRSLAQQMQQCEPPSLFSEIFQVESQALEWLAAMNARTQGIK